MANQQVFYVNNTNSNVSVRHYISTQSADTNFEQAPLIRRHFRRCLLETSNINFLTPNDPYMGRTALLTSKRCILYIYSTNLGTEYFKHALYSPFFSSSKCSLFHNANLFGSCIIHILYTGCAKI